MRVLKLFTALVLLLCSFSAVSVDWPDTVTSVSIDCTNPTARTDGKPLNWATEGGNAIVKILQAGQTLSSMTLVGGCKPATLDLSKLTTYGPHEIAFSVTDSGNRESASVSVPFNRVAAPASNVDLALGKPATASSSESTALGPKYAVDGISSTRWASTASQPQWLRIDLGSPTAISRVQIAWEIAYAKTWSIQTSNDGSAWTTVASGSASSAGTSDQSFAPVGARYVRIYCITRGTQWGFSIWDVHVFAPVASPLPPSCCCPGSSSCPPCTSQ